MEAGSSSGLAKQLNEQRFHVIKETVPNLIAQNRHDDALKLVRDMGELIRVSDLIQNNFDKMPSLLARTSYIFGTLYLQKRDFTLALECVEKGLTNATGDILDDLLGLKKQLTKLIEAEAKEQLTKLIEAEAKEEITKSIEAEAKAQCNKQKPEKEKAQKKLENAKEDHQVNNTEEPEHEEVDSKLKVDVLEPAPEAPKPKVSKFSVSLDLEIKDGDFESSSRQCFSGSVSTPLGRVSKSFLWTDFSQVSKIEELTKFCSGHQSLLSVEHAIPSPGGGFLLMAEEVLSVEEFFQNKLNDFTPNSKQKWWDQIKEIFCSIFRDIVRGMMHIFANGSTCGDVSFNLFVTERGLFVTERGEGRVLPFLSIGKRSAGDDLKQLAAMMKTIISSPFSEDADLSFLPYSLTHFFNHIGGAATLLSNEISPEFVIDHPYFSGQVNQRLISSLK